MKTQRVKITGTAAKYKNVKDKEYRMVELKDGTIVSRDCTYPLDGPKNIAKSAVKAVEKKSAEIAVDSSK